MSGTARAPLIGRLWTYQAERFPVFKHGLLIVVFSGGEALYGAHLRDPGGAWRPNPEGVAVAAAVCFLLFLQLRLADEHKDAEDDARWRPERPVPRGLVTLAELRSLGFATMLAQAAVTALYHPPLLIPLAVVWAFMALMSVEFFAPRLLRARPVLYLATHMAVMPLIAWFAVSSGYGAPAALSAGPALAAFLGLALCNGVMLEIGRKTWAPASEREGVETYSRLWGPRPAALAVGVAGSAGALAALAAERLTDATVWSAGLVALGWAGLVAALALFVRRLTPKAASTVEAASGLMAFCAYLGVAWLPTALWAWRARAGA